MRLYNKHISLLLSLCALSACSEDDVIKEEPIIPDSEKTPIELSVGSFDAPTTRAVITDGAGKKLRAFSAQTRLFFAFVAEDGSNKKYGFNYGTAAAATDDQKDNGNIKDNTKSSISFSNNYLYWDDAYARDSKVSVYSIAVANKVRGNVKLTPSESIAIGTESPGQAIIPFTTTNPGDPTFKWQIANPQTQEVFEWADLIFSNNIADYTSAGKSDNRLKFHTESGDMYHKFDKGELIYYHALTQFTIKIKCGDGFKGDGSDFKFTNASGVACTSPNNSFGINGFYGADGVFYIGSGEFAAMTEANKRDYTSIYKVNETHQKETAGDYYVLKAYVFPGTDMSASGVDNAFSFILDGNKYDVSLANLYDAIKSGPTNVAKQGSSPTKVDASILDEITVGEGGKRLKAGYNYEFSFTVGKSKIKNITAQVVDWENVIAENITPKTNYIEVTTAVVGEHKTDATDFDLYRLPYISNAATIDMTIKNYDWVGRYTDKAKLTGPTSNVWGTNWYFDSNKHFYHFRAVSPKAVDPETTTVKAGTSPADDYLDLTTHVYSSTASESYTDVLWGAPFLAPTGTSNKYSYSATYGFDGTAAPTTHQIHHGIVTTESTINLLLFHMMSDVTFNITTTTGDDKVDLQTTSGSPAVTKNTQVELIGYRSSGKVLMGNGLVETTGEASTSDSPYNLTMDTYTAPVGTTAAAKSVFHYGVVPQSLEGVTLRITTPDDNRYEVTLKNVAKSSFTNYNLADPYSSTNKIDYWYPGFKYTYNLTLKKTGIDLKATIVEWEEISADQNVQIK